MAFKELSTKECYYPFLRTKLWKEPFFYIVLIASICLYVFIFIEYRKNDIFGILNTRIYEVLLASIFFSFSFFHVYRCFLVEKFKSIFIRVLILFGFLFLFIAFMQQPWYVRKYDHEKMHGYIRILPLGEFLEFKQGEMLQFNKINSIEYYENRTSDKIMFRFILNDSTKFIMKPDDFTYKTVSFFLLHLHNECDWLREDIENLSRFYTIDIMTNLTQEDNELITFNDIIRGSIAVFFIFLILAQLVCAIFAAFKIRL